MKRLGVAGIILSRGQLLLGRRGKDPNRGRYVLPGGGVKDGESLDEAFCREVLEETGVAVPADSSRWTIPTYLIELPDRIVIVTTVLPFFCENPPVRDGDDLYDVAWWSTLALPKDLSPVIIPPLVMFGLVKKI